MYDFNLDLPFTLGDNIETITFILNIGIPIFYLANFLFLFLKLRKFDKDQPFYKFVKSLVYFFLFYGAGAIYFVWFDFFYMDFTSPPPISVLLGVVPSPPLEAINMWKIGILLQNIGLILMLNELRGKVFKSKFMNRAPIIWELIGIPVLLLWGYLPVPIETSYFLAEVNFLFNFTWSVCLPITYGYIFKNAAGNLRKYAGMLFICLLAYGLSWGFRTRFAVEMGIAIFAGLDPNPVNYTLIWLIRAAIMDVSLLLVLHAYRKLLATFK
jgi:hypothetical protein